MSNTGFLPWQDDSFSNNPGGLFDGAFLKESPGDDDDYFRPIGLDDRLSVSFATDGTTILNHQSSLYETFSGLLSAEKLEATILDAFQAWASLGNLNIARVADSGDPFGVPGRTYDDPRFGDIRIGAIPMAGDVLAIALSQDDFVSGTWAGDILFNSDAKFESLQQVYSVALHEAGHALGLKHSSDPNSVMHPDSRLTRLSDLDRAMFQDLYGTRRLDPFERGSNNNFARRSTSLEFKDDDGVEGLLPVIAAADIAYRRDYDFYKLELPDDYNGPVTFTVFADQISQLGPALTVIDYDGQVVADVRAVQRNGTDVQVTLDSGLLEEDFYIRVRGTGKGFIGSYTLTVAMDDRLDVDPATLERVARDRNLLAIEPEDLVDYVRDPDNYLFNEDAHQDDDDDSANPLGTEAGYSLRSRYRYNASLLDAQDIDVYSIQTPNFDSNTGPVFLNASVRSVEIGGMIPQLTLVDQNGLELPSQVVVNGLGEYAIQSDAVDPESNYFVRVGADDFLAFQSGNYELTVSFSDSAVDLRSLAQGNLGVSFDGSPTDKKFHSLHVAESRMFQFAFEADPMQFGRNALIWISIYDKDDALVYQAATRTGERRTAHATYLRPGSYKIEVESASNARGRRGPLANVHYRLFGIDVGGSQGPAFQDPTASPFDKNSNGDYVYPDDVISSETFVLVDGISSNQTDPPNDPPPTNLYDWYWAIRP